MSESLLSVRNLKTYFFTYKGVVKAVDDVSFEIGQGESLGIVGETGCGKSVTASSIIRLLSPTARVMGGEILFEGEDMLTKNMNEIKKIRGNEISMIFQDPMTSLDPVFKCGDQLAEVIEHHQNLGRDGTKKKMLEMLKHVRIPDPESRARNYPHELSGGMRQRIMIAIALACQPKLLIADEPTTALDVTVQAQILQLMDNLRREMGTSIIMITHNLGVVAEMCEKVAVMYCGNIVEYANIKSLFHNHRHPYTEALLGALPVRGKSRLESVAGDVPNPINPPEGCKFHPRCKHAMDICSKKRPPTISIEKDHTVACYLVN